ncbi:MAG: hypothetical protein LH702_08930, partial [Phormidesmis sp. CAN_BIN44]|nr:hypothetical protein [Phormidesmis sp. CAN_BIN44]
MLRNFADSNVLKNGDPSFESSDQQIDLLRESGQPSSRSYRVHTSPRRLGLRILGHGYLWTTPS